ncbi:MAG: acyloxyacyl hydrolase, partial [Marinirhabdus sp.]
MLIRALLLIGFLGCAAHAQTGRENPFSIDVNYYYGTLMRHNANVANLVANHPRGFLLNFNHKTYGEKRWQREYNYPDLGFSFLYNNFQNPVLGENYGLYLHYNFYFLKRHLQLRIAEGVAYGTRPFDIETNFKNVAFGTKFLASSYLSINYTTQNLFHGFGLQGGIIYVHHSNGSFKAPNSGTNTLAFNVGVQYHFDSPNVTYVGRENDQPYSGPIAYNFVFRGGVNESDYLNLGQHPFYIFSVFADKRLTYKNTFQFGAEFLISKFLQKEIQYVAAAFPTTGITGNEDYKRVGVFVGH